MSAIALLYAWPSLSVGPVGGPDVPVSGRYAHVIEELTTKEEILSRHLASLQTESKDVQRTVRVLTAERAAAVRRGDTARVREVDREIAQLLRSDAEIAEAHRVLERFQRDREAFAAFVRASEQQVLQSQVAIVHPVLTEEVREIPGTTILTWPVAPLRGLSATFRDEGYARRFGRPHDAIDIPVAQGTPIRAPRNGVVVQAVENGRGYSYIEVQHGRNLTTRYGHVSAIAVSEGSFVRRGEILGLSGGRPGSRGAGFLTTGSHLHFEVIADGRHVDPLALLPQRASLAAAE